MVLKAAEPVEKPFSIVNEVVLGGLMAPHDCEIVDCGAFCEVIFSCISHKNLLGDFFDRLAIVVANRKAQKVLINFLSMQ